MYSYKKGIPQTDDVSRCFDAGTTIHILALPMKYAGILVSVLIMLDHITQFSH